MDIFQLIYLIDLAGVAVFAATGSLVASRKELDLIGFAAIATFTAVGGGTVRDVLLSRTVFWLNDQVYLFVCLGVAVFAFFFAHRLQRRYVALIWADAIGLAVFAVMGAFIALQEGSTAMVAVLFGVMTATFGGLIRDVIAGETPLLLKPEIYISAALVSAGLFTLAETFEMNTVLSVIISVLAGFAVRGGAIKWGWVLPRYKNRAGKDYS